MRKRLGGVDPFDFSFKTIFTQLQRGKVLDRFRLINHHVLLSIDGTGMFFSKSVHCCETHPRDGTKTYFHHMLCAALVHPIQKIVIPLMPEPIVKTMAPPKMIRIAMPASGSWVARTPLFEDDGSSGWTRFQRAPSSSFSRA